MTRFISNHPHQIYYSTKEQHNETKANKIRHSFLVAVNFLSFLGKLSGCFFAVPTWRNTCQMEWEFCSSRKVFHLDYVVFISHGLRFQLILPGWRRQFFINLTSLFFLKTSCFFIFPNRLLQRRGRASCTLEHPSWLEWNGKEGEVCWDR